MESCKCVAQVQRTRLVNGFAVYCELEKGHAGPHEVKMEAIPGTEQVSPWNMGRSVYLTMRWHEDAEPVGGGGQASSRS